MQPPGVRVHLVVAPRRGLAEWRVDTSRWEFYARQPSSAARASASARAARPPGWRAAARAARKGRRRGARPPLRGAARRRPARELARRTARQIASWREPVNGGRRRSSGSRTRARSRRRGGAAAALGKAVRRTIRGGRRGAVAAASLGQASRRPRREARRREGPAPEPEGDLRQGRGAVPDDAALDRFKVSVGVDQAWGAIFDDAADLLYREIDYRCEAAHAREFAENFRDAPWVTTPEIFDDLSTEHVLTMAYVPGVSLKDVAAIEADPSLDAKSLARNLARCYRFALQARLSTRTRTQQPRRDAAIPKAGSSPTIGRPRGSTKTSAPAR